MEFKQLLDQFTADMQSTLDHACSQLPKQQQCILTAMLERSLAPMTGYAELASTAAITSLQVQAALLAELAGAQLSPVISAQPQCP